MNMCLLELNMCEKFRSSHFEYEGGGGWVVKSLRTGGLKILGLGGYQFGEGLLLIGGGGSTPLHAMIFFQTSHSCVTECTLQKKILLKLT